MDRRRAAAAALAVMVALSGCTSSTDPGGTAAPPTSAGPAESADPPRPDPERRDGGTPPADEPDATSTPAREETPPPPVPATRERVVGDAGTLLEAVIGEIGSEAVSVYAVDAYGREVLRHRADAPVLPASTLKTVTAAAALVTFGRSAVFTTRVDLTAPIGTDGSVDGDLVLIGSGDPVLSTDEYARWVYPDRPRTSLAELADEVADAGVTQVRGDVVGTADRFAGPDTAEGWPDRYFSALDTRFAGGLTVDAGLRTTVTWPEPEPEKDQDEAEAGGGDERDRDRRERDGAVPPSPARRPGDLDPDVAPDVRIEHAENPARHAAAELVRLLAERGIEVDGRARTGAVDPPLVGRIADVDSPPIGELLRFALQRSDNHLTDGVFRALGRARTGTGSFDSGERAVRQALEHLGVDPDGLRMADGSGLSREDRAPVRLLVEVDRAMQRSRHAGVWRSLMAVTGESGTLERRLANGVAARRFRGKTGTLRDVTAISGTVGAGPGRYHLAVIINDASSGRWIGRVFADELITLLAADVADCQASPGPGGPGALGIPALAVVC